MMKKIHCFVIAGLLLLISLSLTACSHTHKWKDATCFAPKTCAGCGETEGEKLTHIPGEEGKCTLCGWAMNITVQLGGDVPAIRPVVFGGVRFSAYIVKGAPDAARLTDYTVYDANGNTVAEGSWNGMVPFPEEDDAEEDGPLQFDSYYYGAYHQLPAGTYTVTCNFYRQFNYDLDLGRKVRIYVPMGELSQGTCSFTVK